MASSHRNGKNAKYGIKLAEQNDVDQWPIEAGPFFLFLFLSHPLWVSR